MRKRTTGILKRWRFDLECPMCVLRKGVFGDLFDASTCAIIHWRPLENWVFQRGFNLGGGEGQLCWRVPEGLLGHALLDREGEHWIR